MEGEAGEDRRLLRGVVALDVGGRVGLGVAETLRVGEDVLELGALLVHAVEDVVRRAVDDAHDPLHAVAGERVAQRPDDRDGAGGGGLVSMAEMDDSDLLDLLASFQDAFSWLRRPEIVSIAAVQGHAVGAGFQLALACDFRVLSEDARFAMRETSLGLVPDLGGTHPLVEAIGYPRALEICVTGRWIDADEARKLGLATIVVDHDDMDGTVDDLAGAVLASPRNAVASTKALLRGAVTRDHDEQMLAERVAQVGRIRELRGIRGRAAEEFRTERAFTEAYEWCE